MAPHFKQVAIVGVGLIGGSLGMVLKRRGLADSVVGIGRRIETLRTAVQLGAIDRYVSEAEEGVRGADLVVLAPHLESYAQHLKAWGGSLEAGAIVTDAGSVKGRLVELAEELLPQGVHFVGGHPIAGSEKSGAAAGSPTLFQGARCILTPTARTDPGALKAVRDLWEAAGATVTCMDPHLHDRMLGAVSHLPHVVAYALMNTLLDVPGHGLTDPDLLAYAGGGLRDTTRIAASPPEMWRDICLWNRDNLVPLIEVYERHLDRLKQLLRAGDGPGLEKELERAREARARLNNQ